MDIEKFVKKHMSALKWYRRIYKILDFAAISLILYTLFVIFNMDAVFSMISTFELYTGSTYRFLGFPVPFETLGLIAAAVILSLLITVLLHLRNEKTDAIQLIEDKYPSLRERLRTAYDNRSLSNIIVDRLMSAVLSDTSAVRASSFLNKKRLAFGITALIVTSSLFAFITTSGYRTDITPQDVLQIVENLPLIQEEEEEKPQDLFPVGEDSESDEGGGENLFGEPAIIVVEGKEIDLTLPPGAGVGFSIREEAERREYEFERSSAYDISVISSQAYYENLPEGYQDIIKTYFEEMAKE